MAKRNQVRVIGGRWRHRLISFDASSLVRPTPDRARETLFNWLGQSLESMACLDLFAGSGALGFEAASRGAASVVMVESDRVVSTTLQRNVAMLEADNVEVCCQDALDFLAVNSRKFDVIFLDPPFRQGFLPLIFDTLGSHISPGGMVYVESEQMIDIPAGYVTFRRSRVGRVNFLLLEFTEHDGALQ